MKFSLYWMIIPFLFSASGCKKSKNLNPVFKELRIFNDGYSVSDLFFINKDTRFAVSSFRLPSVQFASTYDGGAHWQMAPMYIDGERMNKINNIFSLNGKTIYATYGTSFSSGLCYSTDFGQTWKSSALKSSGTNANYHSVIFTDPNTGFINKSSVLMKTADGGKTWKEVLNISGIISYGRTCFMGKEVGYSYGGESYDGASSGIILKTSDGGESWKILPFNPAYGQVTSLVFHTDNEGYAFTFLSKVFKTSDGGNTWTQIKEDLPGVYFAAAVHKGALYYATEYQIFKSNDDLKHSTEVFSTTSELQITQKIISVPGALYIPTVQGVLKAIIQ